jgi:prepilin-type N-terminal cleavage/methylation domain-containing protein
MIKKKSPSPSGFTLIELLVAISILSAIAVLAIPRVRSLNRERGIREAARVVGSIFAEAGIRARTDGFCAVGIRRNTRYVRLVLAPGYEKEIYYAATSLFLLKKVPPYTGNGPAEEDRTAIINSITADLLTVSIPEPLSADLSTDFQSVFSAPGYQIRLGSISCPLNIIGFIDFEFRNGKRRLVLSCERPPYIGLPPLRVPIDFRLDRPLQEVSDSEVQVPRGYLINLNYSGPTTAPNGTTLNIGEMQPDDSEEFTWTKFSEAVPSGQDPTQPIIIAFGPSGEVDGVYPRGRQSIGGGRSISPRFQSPVPINLCICPDDERHTFPNSFGVPTANLPPYGYASTRLDLLADNDIHWVSVNHRDGSVITTANAPVLSTFDWTQAGYQQPERVLQAQGFRTVSQDAAQ